jgi:hypothetical protein
VARYLQPNVIKAAVLRLGESRASKSVLNFLVFKRASVRAHEPVVSFSTSNPNLGKAVDDLAHLAYYGEALPSEARDKPYVDVFSPSDSAWRYRNAGWRTNGTGPALSGAIWRGIVDIVSEKPRSGQLSPGYIEKLPGVLLKNGTNLPALADAAIWYHRATDLDPAFGGITDSHQLDERLRESFTNQLGLTEEEIAAIFDESAKPLDGQSLDDILRDTVANPPEFLTDLGGVSGKPTEMLTAFEAVANGAEVGLCVGHDFLLRFTAALGAKRFLILSGLAGSGKTKLAQAFARWITPAPDEGQLPAYAVIPVGADWTGNDNILGYPDGLDATRYVTRPALDLIQRAAQPENLDAPHFLILDEMNLSHVERYFADLLSLIESGEATELYRPGVDVDGETVFRTGVEPALRLPPNLFIIGTVNVDETTYMFSPKVLDRANVIEFRMSRDELRAFLAAPRSPAMDELNGRGSGFGAAFVTEAGRSLTAPAGVRALFQAESLLFFDLLSDHNAEFGFRVANEAARFLHFYLLLGGYAEENADWFDGAMDAIIVQKFLPKLHGSRPKLEGLLWALAWACGANRAGLDDAAFLAQCREAGRAQEETRFGPEGVVAALAGAPARYPLSFDKVMRMWRKLVRDQFVTFSEA